MHRVLQNGPLVPWLEEELARKYEVTQLHKSGDRAAFLAQHGASFDALVTSARFGADAALLDALPNVRAISSFGVGYDTIDLERTRQRGIPVGYTPDVLNDCVADTAFGLVIDVARRFSAADRFTRSGAWQKSVFPLATKVSGKRLGIVGLGRIGRVVAKRASGFDMEVRYRNRRQVADVPYAYEPTLKGLAQWADFLVIVSAGGDATRHLVNSEILDALGPQGFLVNVSRGTVIDEQALVQALRDKRIAGAGLDVYEDEPKVPSALFDLDNCVLLPHIASATNETRRAMAERVIENLDSFFAAGRVPVAVPNDA